MAKTLSTMLPLGTKAPSFTLPDPSHDGRLVSLDDFAGSQAYLVMFICNHCPFVIHIRETLLNVTRQLRAQGVAVIAINSNDADLYPADNPEAMAREAKQYDFPFPYLFDADQSVAKAYQAACTPDFFLFDQKRELVYRGQLDSSRPGNHAPNDGADLLAAAAAVLDGRKPNPTQLPSMGCNIKWKPSAAPH